MEDLKYLIREIQIMEDASETGIVKWFSNEKGYGFITLEDNRDVFFHVSDVIGPEIPQSGDLVSFKLKEGEKGLRAVDVEIIDRNKKRRDDRIECPSCGRMIVPRLIIRQGELDRSVCPFCGETIEDFASKCFIATAVYGNDNCYEVMVLRRFRDEILASKYTGKLFIKLYYIVSPHIAVLLEKNKLLSLLVKKIIDSIVKIIEKYYRTSP